MKEFTEEEIKRNRERYKKHLQDALKIPKEGEEFNPITVDFEGVIHFGHEGNIFTKIK